METTTNFETNFPNPEAESELLRIAGVLETLDPKNKDHYLEVLKNTAVEIEKIVRQIIDHPIVKGHYSYNGIFFENNKEMIRIEDGLHFLKSITTSKALEQAYKLGGGREGVAGQIDKLKGELDEAIIQLQSLSLIRKFDKSIPHA
jgi:hypothetical protein